jgi:DNA-binding MarR family transcriptional regulator
LSRPAIEAVFKHHDIDTGEFDVLATLQRAGAPYTLRPTELFETLMISSGGLTDRLSRLEKRGLIARTPSPTDGRSLLVKLTPKGRMLIDRAFRDDMKVEAALLTPLNQKERDTLATLLAKLLSGIEENQVSDGGPDGN